MSDWNDLYAIGATPWDRGTPAPVLEVRRKMQPKLLQGRVLVPGCGLGHDARQLAEHGCNVVAVDIAPLAIERAQQLDADKGVDFRLASFFELPEKLRGTFDLVWEHTCLCALELTMRPQYLAGARSALRPGGTVVGVFYMNPELDPGETGPPFGVSLEELIKFWQDGGFEVQEHWVPEVGYVGRAGRERYMKL